MEICPLRLCTWVFSLWRCVYGDLSIADWRKGDLFLFEDLFMEICPLKICSGDFSFWRCIHEDLSIVNWSVGDLSLFKICSWRFVHWDLFRRFILLKICSTIQDIFPFENMFMEIYPLKIEGKFISFWRFVHRDLSFWRFFQEIDIFEDLFRRFFLFEDVFMEIYPFKI